MLKKKYDMLTIGFLYGNIKYKLSKFIGTFVLDVALKFRHLTLIRCDTSLKTASSLYTHEWKRAVNP